MCLALIKSFHDEEVNIGINFLLMPKNCLLKHLQGDDNDGQCDALLNFVLNELVLIEKEASSKILCR